MSNRSIVTAIVLSAATSLAVPACSTAPINKGVGVGQSAARISAGMTRLGASPEQSECYADKIASALSAPDANEAIQIIDASTSKEEMRNGVLGASASVKQSFIRAHFGCS